MEGEPSLQQLDFGLTYSITPWEHPGARRNGMVDCGSRHEHIKQRAMQLADQVRLSKGSPLMACLLEGPSGSGKNALAAIVGIDSDFPYVKIVSAESMVGLSEATKCARIVKVFEDAYRLPPQEIKVAIAALNQDLMQPAKI